MKVLTGPFFESKSWSQKQTHDHHPPPPRKNTNQPFKKKNNATTEGPNAFLFFWAWANMRINNLSVVFQQPFLSSLPGLPFSPGKSYQQPITFPKHPEILLRTMIFFSSLLIASVYLPQRKNILKNTVLWKHILQSEHCIKQYIPFLSLNLPDLELLRFRRSTQIITFSSLLHCLKKEWYARYWCLFKPCILKF